MKNIILSFSFLALSPMIYGQPNELTLENIWQTWSYSEKSVYGVNSMNDGQHYSTLEREENKDLIVKFSYKTGKKVSTIADSENLKPEGESESIHIDSYSFSKDESRVLISSETERIYRHSTREKNYVFDLKSAKLYSVGMEKNRLATFSPDGSKIAFVRKNNLYYYDVSSGEEQQFTKDGEWNNVINGATDWVYEEEFSFDKAFFWSPNGEKIAFYRFDESEVPEFNMPLYGTLYPKDYKFKYPKAGEKNAKVSIHIYDLPTGKTIQAQLGEEYEYIPRIKWTTDSGWLSVTVMNRHQNNLDVKLVDSNTGASKKCFNEHSETYIDIHDNLTFLKDGKRFIWTSEKSGFNHLYLYDLNGKELSQLTNGKWDVTDFYGVDEEKGVAYFSSAENSPMQRKLYKINLSDKEKTILTKDDGVHTITFSSGFNYFIDYYSNANSPTTVSLFDFKGKKIRTLEDNKELKEKLEALGLSKREFFNFKSTSGETLNGWMLKPPDFDPSKKYPVFMFVYGGPGSQTVKDSWGGTNLMWYHYMARQGYIVASVDNRGTGARGRDFKNCTYKQLGKLETEDQIDAAKYLAELEYTDAERIGIQGWSYGGYMSSLCLSKGSDVFKSAVAVAPVTNWRYYDTIYTERYMQTPDENPDGYDDNSPINHVNKIKGPFLLVHGTADDNVHFQNSVEMNTALISANVQFDLAIYPNKNHSIYGGNSRYHLFTKITNFILENL